MSDRPILDEGALERLDRIGGSDFVVEMIELFLEHGPERVRVARTAFEEGDIETLHRAVHSLKSTAANVGARALQAAAEQAETRADRGDMEEIPTLLDALDREYEEVRGELEAERDRRKVAGRTEERT